MTGDVRWTQVDPKEHEEVIAEKDRLGKLLSEAQQAKTALDAAKADLSRGKAQAEKERDDANAAKTRLVPQVGFGLGRFLLCFEGYLRVGPVRFGSVRFGSVRYGTVRYGTVRYGTVRYGTVRFDTVRYGTVRYGLVRLCCAWKCFRLFSKTYRVVTESNQRRKGHTYLPTLETGLT